MRIYVRRALVTAASLSLALVAVPGAAHAATVGETPLTSSVTPYKACPTKPNANCAAVYAVVAIGATVYIGGDFTTLLNPNGSDLAVSDLAALDGNGAPVPTFTAHSFNGAVRALATDGTRLFVGGQFTKIDGAGPASLAAFTPAGARLSYPGNGQTVRGLEVTGTSLYIASTTVTKRDTTGVGTADPVWSAPTLASTSNSAAPMAWTVKVAGSRVYVGGHFDTVNGVARRSLAALDPASGSVDTSFAPAIQAEDFDTLQGVPDLAVTTDAVIAPQEGHWNRAYKFDLSGRLLWSITPDGDGQTVAVDGSTVYIGGHFDRCANLCYDGNTSNDVPRDHIAALDYSTGKFDDSFAPHMGDSFSPYYYGVWVIRKVLNRLWVGGVFNNVTVGGTTLPVRKLAIFA